MSYFRLRTQLFFATLLIIVGLTGALLLIIHKAINHAVTNQVREGTQISLRAFENVQTQRSRELARSTAILAELPTLKALMTTQDAPTIQDGSETFWKLTGSDLFVLARNDQSVVAVHAARHPLKQSAVENDLRGSVARGADADWWYDGGRLYWVFLQPITAGAGNTSEALGSLAVGYEVDSSVAEELGLASGNQLVIAVGDAVVAATLPQADEDGLQALLRAHRLPSQSADFSLSTDHYAFSAVEVPGANPASVRCYVLMPLAPVKLFIQKLDRTILVLGACAVLFGGLLFGFVARTVTRPLDNLVSGVRALAEGDFSYSIIPKGSSEVAELGTSFARMRDDLLTSQQQRIETERLAAVAEAASSISHDLRHYLAAVVANAEFLYEADDLKLNRAEIYGEIKTASDQMTDLIDSFRELSYQRNAIVREPTSLEQIIRRAMEAINARAEFREVRISLRTSGGMVGLLDPKKLERVFFNLILNACEATREASGQVILEAKGDAEVFAVRVIDEGGGIPAAVRETLFQPFVSCGKVNGTGLGLAIVNKIVEDHGGAVGVESSTAAGTVMLVQFPRILNAESVPVNTLS
ncbi:MAG: HAMP domain-containing sensor histidine kinase [Candidatus Acidiferrum sp.]|jgi:signal transduction histidine kinase